MANFDVQKIRSQFPVLRQKIHGKRLAYLDNGATTQKPQIVIDAIRDFYETYNANVHRGIHTLSEKASEKYESVRGKVKKFINAQSEEEVIFVRGTTEGINLVASAYVDPILAPGDKIITTIAEHHSNFVPWQVLAKKHSAQLVIVPVTKSGEIDLEFFKSNIKGAKLVSVVHVSNVLGMISPIKQITEIAHANNVPVLIDGAQSVAHMPIDVEDLDIDFLALSGHKMYGPTGIGVLYGKRELLEKMSPYQYGGDMIGSVDAEESTWNDLPFKFEAGTPNIADTIGLGAAIDFLASVGMSKVRAHERELLEYAQSKLSKIDKIDILGPKSVENRSGLFAFNIKGLHSHDLATLADERGVAFRAGFHCAEPLHRSLDLIGSARASFGIYNNKDDVDQLVEAIGYAKRILK